MIFQILKQLPHVHMVTLDAAILENHLLEFVKLQERPLLALLVFFGDFTKDLLPIHRLN